MVLYIFKRKFRINVKRKYGLGGDIPTSKIHIFYENDYLYDFKLSNDTLYVPFTKEAAMQSWSYKPITVVVFDASYNRSKRTFYLRPNATFPEVFSLPGE